MNAGTQEVLPRPTGTRGGRDPGGAGETQEEHLPAATGKRAGRQGKAFTLTITPLHRSTEPTESGHYSVSVARQQDTRVACTGQLHFRSSKKQCELGPQKQCHLQQ